MKTQQLLTALVLSTTLLSACAPKPFVVTPKQMRDETLSCIDLQNEINQARRYKEEARNEDHFQWKYLLIVPAVHATYNWSKAENAAEARINHLQTIYQQNGCTGSLGYESQPTQGISPYAPSPYQDHAPSPYSYQPPQPSSAYPTNPYGSGNMGTSNKPYYRGPSAVQPQDPTGGGWYQPSPYGNQPAPQPNYYQPTTPSTGYPTSPQGY